MADLADPGTVDGLGRRLPEPLDSLVHAPASSTSARSPSCGCDQWRSSSTSTSSRPAVLTRALLPALRAARGTVVFVNSVAGPGASPKWAAYAASKFGLRALADALRAEEDEHGVRVTSVYPEPHRDADAGEGPRAGGQGRTTPAVDPAGDRRRHDPARARPARGRDDPRGDRASDRPRWGRELSRRAPARRPGSGGPPIRCR